MITGHPIQAASQVVVWPLKGTGSNAISMRLYRSRYSRGVARRTNSRRSLEIHAELKAARMRSSTSPQLGASRISRESGTLAKTLDHSMSVFGVTFARLF